MFINLLLDNRLNIIKHLTGNFVSKFTHLEPVFFFFNSFLISTYLEYFRRNSQLFSVDRNLCATDGCRSYGSRSEVFDKVFCL